MDIDFLKLDKKAPTLIEMMGIPCNEDNAPFVSLKEHGFPSSTKKDCIPPSTGEDIYVRKGVLDRLRIAQEALRKTKNYEGFTLEVTYGFRSPTIQHQEYIKQLERFYTPTLSPLNIMERAHEFIACPTVAGHPTGASVDVWITDLDGSPLDFGTDMHELNDGSKVTNTDISSNALQNRYTLRACMMEAGFAPYNGEWWHFSYGDREHAIFWEHPVACYKAHEYDSTLNTFTPWQGTNLDYEEWIIKKSTQNNNRGPNESEPN